MNAEWSSIKQEIRDLQKCHSASLPTYVLYLGKLKYFKINYNCYLLIYNVLNYCFFKLINFLVLISNTVNINRLLQSI